MNETSGNVWFYTREGEKIGPVSFADLHIAAREGRLNPRHDMAWTQGMDTWLPAGEIDGLFERREETAEPAETRAGPEPGEPQGIELDKHSGWPGCGRAGYFFIPLLFSLVWAVAFAFGLPRLQPHVGNEIMVWIMLLAPWVPAIVVFFVVLSRFRNLGMSRWWILGFLVPLLNLWIGYRLFACPAGYPWHRKMDGAGWFLAIVYWGFHLLAIAAIGIAIAIMAGSLGNPEFRQKIEDVFREARARQEQLQRETPAPASEP